MTLTPYQSLKDEAAPVERDDQPLLKMEAATAGRSYGPCCKTLQRMEADEAFEARIRALEGWRAETGGRGAEVSTLAAGRRWLMGW